MKSSEITTSTESGKKEKRKAKRRTRREKTKIQKGEPEEGCETTISTTISWMQKENNK
jgi:hypothetical protein